MIGGLIHYMDKDLVLETIRVMAGSKYIFLLISVIMLDIMVGTVKAFILGESNSDVGLKGLIKHSIVLIVTIVVSFYLLIFDLDLMGRTWVLFFIVQYITSLIENWGKLGLPLPEFIKEKIYILNENINKGVLKNEDK